MRSRLSRRDPVHLAASPSWTWVILRDQGVGFRVQGTGLGFRVQGSGFRVQGAVFRVQDVGFMVPGSRVKGFRINRATQVLIRACLFVRTGSWTGPPQGKRAPRVGPICMAILARE